MIEDPRVPGLEANLEMLTKQVMKVTDVVERLVVVEQRNKALDDKIEHVQQILDLKIQGLAKDLTSETEALTEIKTKLDQQNTRLNRILGGLAVVVFILEPALIVFLSYFGK